MMTTPREVATPPTRSPDLLPSVQTAGPGEPPDARLVDPCAEREAAGKRLHAAMPDESRGQFDVFLAGTVFMDMIFTGLPGLPPPGTELLSDGLGSAPGGSANMAVAMSRLGLKSGLAAAFGDDMFGAYLWRALAEQEGVDLSRSRRLTSWPTPVTVSLADDSDRGMVTHHRPLPIPPDELVIHAPRTKTCVVELDRGLPDWAIELRRAGTTVFADVGWDNSQVWSNEVLSRLEHVDVFLPNAVEAMAYTRTRDPGAALEALATLVPVVVVKLGCHGATAIDNTTGERASAPALPLRALDPTGAGDVFAAGFVFGTLAGWPLVERLKFANLCAGLSVRHYSGSLGAPCWGELAAFGESGDLPQEVLAEYGFIVPYIPDPAVDTVTRADPTLGYGGSAATGSR